VISVAVADEAMPASALYWVHGSQPAGSEASRIVMNTALTISSSAPATEVGAVHGLTRMAQATRARVLALFATPRQPLSRDELAALHERRLEGARLRDEMRRSVYLTHTF
jgi:hypothetical protein